MNDSRALPILLAAISLLLVVSALARPGLTASDKIVGVEVEGTSLIVRLSSGRAITGPALVGSTLSLIVPGNSEPQRVRIDDVVVDPRDPDHETMLYRMKIVSAAGGPDQEICGPDPQGERWAFPVRGQWDAAGHRVSNDGFTLTCSDGAQGKCVRFGYKPWKTLANGTSLADYHQACIWLITASYCDHGATTRNGMLIDIYDHIGIQLPDEQPSELKFEAAWGTKGAVCVAHTRVPENITLDRLGAECPRLAGRLGEEACTETKSVKYGERVLLYNRSK
jgi:ADYC domain